MIIGYGNNVKIRKTFFHALIFELSNLANLDSPKIRQRETSM